MASYTEYIWNYFKAKIGNEYGVAALMGNLEAESGMVPNNMENGYEGTYNDTTYTAAINSGAYTRSQFENDAIGYGIAQWTWHTRKAALYDRWKGGSYSGIDDIKLQCDHLWYELQTEFADVLAVLQTTSSIREASDKVLHDFENPLVHDEVVEVYRASLGQKWYNEYSGTGGEPIDPEQPSGKVNSHKMKLLLMYMAIKRR